MRNLRSELARVERELDQPTTTCNPHLVAELRAQRADLRVLIAIDTLGASLGLSEAV